MQPGFQADCTPSFLRTVTAVVVDNQGIADPEPAAVVGSERKGVQPIRRCRNISFIKDREIGGLSRNRQSKAVDDTGFGRRK